MKKSELITIIKQVLPEVVRPILKEELNKILLETVINNKSQISTQQLQKDVASTKKYTKNPMLNDILNETATAATSPNIQQKSNIRQQYTQLMNESSVEPAAEGVNLNELDGVLNRDYSELVKRFPA